MNIWVRAKREPSAVLLFVQLVSVLAFPFMEDTDLEQAMFSAVGIVVLALAVWAVGHSPASVWISGALAAPAMVILIAQAVTDAEALVPWVEALLAALYLYTAGALIRYMVADRDITRDEIYAVGATFTLVAWAFAHIYTWCQVVYPGSFVAAIDPGEPRSWMELLFLSFTTLSSTGLSDVVPVLPLARALVMLEQVAGVGYLAMVVARLVTLVVARDVRQSSDDR
ncbi:MAG: ion channel [Nocardioidaceae bacterium]